MFDIAWTEMLVLAIIIIVVVGPRDLPKVMRTIGGFMRKARALAGQFQSDMDQLAREAEIDELRKQARAYQDKFRQPVRELDKLVDPTTGEPVSDKQGKTGAEQAKAVGQEGSVETDEGQRSGAASTERTVTEGAAETQEIKKSSAAARGESETSGG